VAFLRLCLALVVAAALLPGCFDPRQPACAFSCAADGLCPVNYHCADDGLCHRDDGQGGVCTLPPQIDAAQDTVDESADSGQD
jgi:hypothetical protein